MNGNLTNCTPAPFDIEIFANSIKNTKDRQRKYRGPDSPAYSALYPMICIIRVFGMAPYEFSRDQMVPSNTLLIFSGVTLALYSYMIYMIMQSFKVSNNERVALTWTSEVMVVFNFSVAIYETLLTVFTRKTFVSVWNAMQDYDEAVRHLGFPRKESKLAIVAWTVLIAQSLIWAAVNVVGMVAFGEKWLYNIGYISIYCGTTVALYKFVGIAFMLGQRFAHLTELAVKNIPPRSGFIKRGNVSRTTVQNLHNELMVAGETLDMMYRWSLFFWLANLCMHSVSNIYFIIEWLLMSGFSNAYASLICCFTAWLMSFMLQLILLHIVCDYTSKKATEIHVVLIDWNVRLTKRFPATEILESSVHLINRKLQFSAAGCFDVDLPLLRSMTAVLSTYLVILLQLPQ